MKALKFSLLVVALAATTAAAQTAVQPPPSERGGSPYDRNPACRDRDVSSADPACVIQDGPSAFRPQAQQAPAVQQQQQLSNPAAPVIIVVPQGAPATVRP